EQVGDDGAPTRVSPEACGVESGVDGAALDVLVELLAQHRTTGRGGVHQLDRLTLVGDLLPQLAGLGAVSVLTVPAGIEQRDDRGGQVVPSGGRGRLRSVEHGAGPGDVGASPAHGRYPRIEVHIAP